MKTSRSWFVVLLVASALLAWSCDDGGGARIDPIDDTSVVEADASVDDTTAADAGDTALETDTTDTTDGGDTDGDADVTADDVDDGRDGDTVIEGPLEVTVLAEGDEVFDARTHHYELVRLHDPGTGQTTYVQWIEPDGGVVAPVPVVVQTQPYAGIDWTGEEVDARWAAMGDGFHLDVDSPGYVDGSGEGLVYDLTTPREAIDNTMIYSLNGVAALHVFGRFYAGGSVRDDVRDMALGMRYLETRDDVDREHIAVTGGSWGGFEAVYATTHAPEAVRPVVTVALFPLTDFAAEWRWADQLAATVQDATRAEQLRLFFAPYLRRLEADTGGGPDAGGDFAGLINADVAAALESPLYVFHDAHDMLVPFTMSQALAAAPGDRISFAWLEHDAPVDVETAPVDHGVAIAARVQSVFTLTQAVMLTRLFDAPEQQLLIAAVASEIDNLLVVLSAQQARGQSLGAWPSMLADLADARVLVFDFESMTFVPGPQFVVDHVNAQWGTTFTVDDVAADLRAMAE